MLQAIFIPSALIVTSILNAKLAEGINQTISDSLYESEKCGIPLNGTVQAKGHVRKPFYKLKIMGGTDAKFGQHPWAVAILLHDSYCCAGTLISKKHVITAAHCFFREDARATLGNCSPKQAITEEEAIKHTKVMYGSNCLQRSKAPNCLTSPPMEIMSIVRAQYGRFFRQNCFGGDMALLELEREIDERTGNYICLANRIVANDQFTTIQTVGWGSNPAQKKIFTNNLQKLEFRELLDQNICREKMPKLPNDVLCTEEIHNQSVCLGDSGGGLMAQLHDGRWLLLGIVSYGNSCDSLWEKAVQPLAQVFTDVRMYGGEIDKFTGDTLPWEQL